MPGISKIRLLLIAALLGSAWFVAAVASVAPGGGSRLLLATYWGDDVVALIDIEAESGREELWRIDVAKAAGCLKPYDVRANSGGSKAYVSCSGANLVVAIDVPAQQVEYTIETGDAPRDLVLFENGQKLLVANSGSDTASVIDLVHRKKLYDFPVAVQPYGVAVTDDGNTALVTGWASGDLHIIDLGTDSAETRAVVEVGLLPYTVVIPDEQSRAFVAINADDEVAVVNIKDGSLEKTIPVGRGPWSLAASQDGAHVLVTNNRSFSLSYISSAALTTVSGNPESFAAGSQLSADGTVIRRRPKNASISADGKKAVFTELAADQIVVMDLPSGELQHAMSGGKAPYGIEFLR